MAHKNTLQHLNFPLVRFTNAHQHVYFDVLSLYRYISFEGAMALLCNTKIYKKDVAVHKDSRLCYFSCRQNSSETAQNISRTLN